MDKKVKKQPQWLGHPILDEDHHNGLEVRAAFLEFHDGLPRHEAEKRALDEYRKDQHTKAAAHHLMGMKAAHAAGEMDASKLHHDMYVNHMKQLGLDPNGSVPPQVSIHGTESSPAKVYDFKQHGADQFLVTSDDQPAPDKEPEKKLAATEKFIDVAKGIIALALIKAQIIKFPVPKAQPNPQVQGPLAPVVAKLSPGPKDFDNNKVPKIKETGQLPISNKKWGTIVENIDNRVKQRDEFNANNDLLDSFRALKPHEQKDQLEYFKRMAQRGELDPFELHSFKALQQVMAENSTTPHPTKPTR